jgi:hypothetical protein
VTFGDKWRSFCVAKWRPAGSGVLATAYKRCSGHSEITGDLSSGFAAFDQADSASNLTVSDPARAATKILPGFSAFGDGIGDAFALDLVFHLRESGHNRATDVGPRVVDLFPPTARRNRAQAPRLVPG